MCTIYLYIVHFLLTAFFFNKSYYLLHRKVCVENIYYRCRDKVFAPASLSFPVDVAPYIVWSGRKCLQQNNNIIPFLSLNYNLQLYNQTFSSSGRCACYRIKINESHSKTCAEGRAFFYCKKTLRWVSM